jgi:RimJ/RimL family protein N-acetyltransferase
VFAAMSADREVMRFYPAPLDRARSDELAERWRDHIAQHGWGVWAVEVCEDGLFVGSVGLSKPRFQAHFTPAVEVGWRLARDHWRNGYATEAARAAVDFGFGDLGLDEIVSFTTVANRPSRRVMERLGMSHDPSDDFDHPLLAEDDPLRPHVLYRLRRGSRVRQEGQ